MTVNEAHKILDSELKFADIEQLDALDVLRKVDELSEWLRGTWPDKFMSKELDRTIIREALKQRGILK